MLLNALFKITKMFCENKNEFLKYSSIKLFQLADNRKIVQTLFFQLVNKEEYFVSSIELNIIVAKNRSCSFPQ